MTHRCRNAFLVSEEEFDEIFDRIIQRDLYWSDPDGHEVEIITRPSGKGSAGR
jgi:hypothetical protein